MVLLDAARGSWRHGSARQVAPVHGWRHAGDVTGLAGGQPNDRVGNLLRFGDTAQRVGGHEVLVQLRVLGDHVGDQRGVDQAWADGVDAYAALGVVQGGALGQADLGVLGGDVAGGAGSAGQAGTGRDVDDRAEALLRHNHQLVLHRGEHAAHGGGEHQVEGLDRVVDERVGVVAAVDAGAVDGHVEAATLAGTSVGAAAGGDLGGGGGGR